MDNVVEIAGLVKSFGRTLALDGLDLAVERGEVHGFLGPNGAGKTTTLRILLGLLRASGGSAILLGGDPWRDAATLHRRLAYVPGDVVLWPNLTGGEIIDILGRFRGGLSKRRRDELIGIFELDPRRKAHTYSKGNRQKVGLVAALASDAELMIFDEPTVGLDPLMEAVFKSQVRAARDEGGSVLLSSHMLTEVEQLCDRVSIIRSGRNVETGTLAELRHLASSRVTAVLGSVPAQLSAMAGVSDVRVDGRRVSFHADAEALDAIMGLLARHEIRSLTIQPPTLEELFLSHYGTDIGAPGAPGASAAGGRRSRAAS
ncbi:ABC transporter ATP-binding protein [Micrococcaceae bacterium Sec5.7]